MIVTDAAIAAVPLPSRGPLRAFLSLIGLATLADDVPVETGSARGAVSPPDWQQARVAAHRAVAAVDSGDLAAADAGFTTAFTLDRSLQPGQIANFWRQSLSGLEVAERALRRSGRYEDAAALASEVAFRYGGHPTRQPSQVAS